MVVLAATMVVVARQVQRLDARRQSAADDVADLNRNLEERVSSGVAELERRHTQLALRNDRDRIARDLHDLVIQRLFASGLQLASMQRLLGPQRAARGGGRGDVGTARGGDRRAERGHRRPAVLDLLAHGDGPQRRRLRRRPAVVDRLGQSLVFDPEVHVDPAVNDLPTEVVDQVLAVLREAVSNVARHARATRAHVAVTVDGTHLQVLVCDDGVGMPSTPARSSGVANSARAPRTSAGRPGGSPRSPRGTRMVWRVPLPRSKGR